MSSGQYLIRWFLLLVLLSHPFYTTSQGKQRVYASKHREANRLVELAKESMVKADYDQAIDLLDQAIQHQTDHLEAYFNRAISKEKIQDPQGALTDLQIVLLIDSTYREAAFNRAVIRYKQKQFNRAIIDFKKVLTMSSGGTRMLYFKGTPLNQESEVPMQGITTTYSMKADIHNYLGLCYQAMGDLETSVKAFDQALSLNPNDANYYVNRGLSESSQGNSDKAVTDFKTALSLEPDHPIAQFNLTQELESSGKLEMAAYNEIIENNPEFASAYVNRALAKINSGNTRSALEDYAKAIALDPHDPVIFINRALAREKLKQFHAALADYNTALKLDPNVAKAYRGRGRVLFGLEEFQLALDDLNESIRLEPSHGASFFNRALVHRKMGNQDGTCADLEQAKSMGVEMASKAFSQYCPGPQ